VIHVEWVGITTSFEAQANARDGRAAKGLETGSDIGYETQRMFALTSFER